MARPLQPVDQLVGNRRAGPVVARVPLQHRRLVEPVLEELRRQLDEVAQHAGARQPLVADVRQQPVQAVAELVKERARVVEAQQRRLAGRGLGEVVVVDDDRQHRLAARRAVARLHAVLAHPGAAALARPGEVVVQEEADRSGGALHLVDGDVAVVGDDVRTNDERDAEQARRAVERGRDHRLEREVRLDLGIVEVEADLANLFGVEAPVPGLDRGALAARERDRGERLALVLGARDRRLPDLLEQRHHRAPALRHRVAEREIGIALVAVQARLLEPQLQDLGGDLAVVAGAGVLAARRPRAPRRLAQVASLGEGEERHDE